MLLNMLLQSKATTTNLTNNNSARSNNTTDREQSFNQTQQQHKNQLDQYTLPIPIVQDTSHNTNTQQGSDRFFVHQNLNQTIDQTNFNHQSFNQNQNGSFYSQQDSSSTYRTQPNQQQNITKADLLKSLLVNGPSKQQNYPTNVHFNSNLPQMSSNLPVQSMMLPGSDSSNFSPAFIQQPTTFHNNTVVPISKIDHTPLTKSITDHTPLTKSNIDKDNKQTTSSQP